MAHPGGFESQITSSTVQDAIVQIMQGDLGRAREVDTATARDMATRILISVQKLGFQNASSAALSGNAAFHTLVTRHLGSTAAAAYDPVFRQQLQQALQRANVHSSEYVAGVKAAAQIGLQYAARHDGTTSDAASGAGRRANNSAFYDHEISGNHTANNLSASLRSLVDPSQNITAAHVADAANFAQRIGLVPGAYAGYFVGSSQAARTAIQNHIQNGARITDDHIKNPRDVAAIIGAIKAGKMKIEDAPPSVRQVIEDMKKKGIDPATADPKDVQKYLKDNPKALEAAKKAAKADVGTSAKLTDEQLHAENDKQEKKRLAASGPKASDGKPAAARSAVPSRRWLELKVA